MLLTLFNIEAPISFIVQKRSVISVLHPPLLKAQMAFQKGGEVVRSIGWGKIDAK